MFTLFLQNDPPFPTLWLFSPGLIHLISDWFDLVPFTFCFHSTTRMSARPRKTLSCLHLYLTVLYLSSWHFAYRPDVIYRASFSAQFAVRTSQQSQLVRIVCPSLAEGEIISWMAPSSTSLPMSSSYPGGSIFSTPLLAEFHIYLLMVCSWDVLTLPVLQVVFLSACLLTLLKGRSKLMAFTHGCSLKSFRVMPTLHNVTSTIDAKVVVAVTCSCACW